MNSDRHVIVISEDAMVYEDLAELRTMPSFGAVLPDAALVERVRTVYPSLTYPVHTSIRTGAYCCRHGIVNNELTNLTEEKSDWEWFNSAVKIPDIFDAAKAAGLTTAAVFWPTTGCHPHIDWLVDEYWPVRPGQTTAECFEESGSSPEVMEYVVRPNMHLVDGRHRQHPYGDLFVNACACEIIRRWKPNLLMIHPANVDAARHATGLFSPAVTHSLHEIDMWLREILKALDDAGIREKTDIFVISDHGQMNICRCVALNALLAERGLIDVDPDGHVRDYTAIAKSTGMSAQIYLKDRTDAPRVQKILEQMCRDGLYGFERVYTAEEALREEGLGGNFSFVLETDGYTSFSNAFTRPLVRRVDNSDYKFGRATHGHNPDKGPQPPLIAWGPHIRAEARVPRRPIVDEAPTFARILGIELPYAQGQAIEEILDL